MDNISNRLTKMAKWKITRFNWKTGKLFFKLENWKFFQFKIEIFNLTRTPKKLNKKYYLMIFVIS